MHKKIYLLLALSALTCWLEASEESCQAATLRKDKQVEQTTELSENILNWLSKTGFKTNNLNEIHPINRRQPIELAISQNKEDIVAELIKKGFSISFESLSFAAYIGYGSLLKLILNNADASVINWQNIYGQTLLMDAAKYHHIDIVHDLLKRGADVNIQDSNGWTALMHSRESDRSPLANIIATVQLLLDYNADITKVSSKHYSTNLEGSTIFDIPNRIGQINQKEKELDAEIRTVLNNHRKGIYHSACSTIKTALPSSVPQFPSPINSIIAEYAAEYPLMQERRLDDDFLFLTQRRVGSTNTGNSSN